MTFDIASLKFVRPEKNVGTGGTFQFNRFFLVYDNLVTDISNEDGRFNANIFVRQNFIGLVGNQIKLGVYGEPGDILTTIKEASGSNLKFSLNSKKLSLQADQFAMHLPTFKLAVNEGSSLFCQKKEEHRSNNPDDLEIACLNYLNFKPEGHESVKAEVESIPTTEDETYIKFKGSVKQLELSDKQIVLNTQNMTLDLDHDYLIRANSISVNCLKKDLESFNSDEITQFCLNGFDVQTSSNISVENMNDHSSFVFNPTLLKIENSKFMLQTPMLSINESNSATNLDSLAVSCHIDPEKDGTDVGTYMEGCLEKGDVELSSLESSDTKEHKIFSKNLKDNNKKKGTLRDVKLTMRDGDVILKARVKFLFKFKLRVEGSGVYNEASKELKFHVDKARLPLGISSVKLLMYFMKKLVASDTVIVSGKDIIIKL